MRHLSWQTPIKPKSVGKKITFKVSINSNTADQIKQYCDFAGFKSNDEFLEEAAMHILTKDKDFKEWTESKEKSTQKIWATFFILNFLGWDYFLYFLCFSARDVSIKKQIFSKIIEIYLDKVFWGVSDIFTCCFILMVLHAWKANGFSVLRTILKKYTEHGQKIKLP